MNGQTGISRILQSTVWEMLVRGFSQPESMLLVGQLWGGLGAVEKSPSVWELV